MDDEERKIEPKLVLAYIFKQWRKILIVTLMCGLVGAGYKFLKIIPTYSSLMETYSQNVEAYETSNKTIADQNKKTQDIIDQLTEYSQKSIKANIDPYSETQTTATISVVTSSGHDDFEALLNGTNHANQITQAYVFYINIEIDYSKLAEKMGTTNNLIKELVTVNSDFNTDMILVTVIGNSKEQTEEIIQYILAQTSQYENKIRTEYGDYSSIVSPISTSVVTDSGLVTPINAQMLSPNLSMNDTLTKINTLKTSIDTISKTALSNPESVNRTILKTETKYFALGIFVGFFGMLIILALIILYSDKVYSEDDLKYFFETKVLTVMPIIKNNNKTKFDQYLYSKIDSAYGISQDIALEKASVNIEAYRGGMNKLLLINSKTNQDINELKKKLETINHNCKFMTTANLNASAEELKKLKDSEGVIVVIERNVTKRVELSANIETVNNWNKPIVGCIVL